MSSSEDAKPDPTGDTIPTPEIKETESVAAPTGAREDKSSTEQSTYTGMASAATSSATSAAVGVKDSVFSMFGGGAKKEKKEEEEAQDRSGSSKAQKDAEAEEDEVHHTTVHILKIILISYKGTTT